MEKIKYFNKNYIDRICILCTADFKSKPSDVIRGYGKYCSASCRSKVSNINGNLKTLSKYNGRGELNANWKGGLTKNHYAYKLMDKKRNPEKHKAREAVKRAKKSGKLIPEPCLKCGEENVQAHHEDYSKPLDIIWLCAPCHYAEHRKQFRPSLTN